MAEPFLSEIRLFSFVFAPKGWALCNGQLLPINQNQALFSLLGTTFGGDGRVNFALPDLRGRVPIHVGRQIRKVRRAQHVLRQRLNRDPRLGRPAASGAFSSSVSCVGSGEGCRDPIRHAAFVMLSRGTAGAPLATSATRWCGPTGDRRRRGSRRCRCCRCRRRTSGP